MILSAMRTVEKRCAMTSEVASWAMARSRPKISASASASIAAVGSSSTRMGALRMKARLSAIFCH